ncbi:hypothetical protein ABVK33_10060 [Mycobacterium kansasii]|uniref:hypothetical protein n=1 Tax=Mycobacterium kansasii TaxID=1768 RepID=UPI000F02D20C|nr:hypothetical protein [Mycobacterium kansasii]VAZ65319.1 hypothetical protein LAUMK40_01444 [Mycobacterium kansasii]
MNTYRLPLALSVHRSTGHSTLSLALNKSAKLQPLLTFADTKGRSHVLELTREECAALAASLIGFCMADRRQLECWELELGLANS